MLTNSSILTATLLVPALGGLTIFLIPPLHAKKARHVALSVSVATLLLSILAATRFNWNHVSYAAGDPSVQLSARFEWLPSVGTQYFVGIDGISLPLLLLTTSIGLMAIWASYGISKSIKTYYALMLFLLAGAIGVFISLDLILFGLFFEGSLLPLLLLIGIWGGTKKEFAAIKCLLYALLGSIGTIMAIVGIYLHTRGMGDGGGAVFDVIRLATDPLIKSRLAFGGDSYHLGQIAFWLFFAGFAVRIPSVPLHSWLPDAHAESPTPLSMILTAIMLPMGGYGLLRICYPLFPQQAADAWLYVAGIGIVSIVFGALVAMAQKDFKRLVTFTGVSNMGYVVLGLSVMNPIATEGAIFQLIAQSISSALMFFVVGVLSDRARHREIRRFGGIWSQLPAYTGWAAVGFFASMGLPGLCGFVGQFLVLLGVFSSGDPASFLMHHTSGTAYVPLIWLGCIAAAAGIFTVGYLVWTLQRIYMGAPKQEHHNFPGLTASEKWILATLGLAAITLGIAPALLLDHIRPAIDGMMRLVSGP